MAEGEARKTERPYSAEAVQALLDVKIHPLLKNGYRKLESLADILHSDEEIITTTDLINRSIWFDQKKIIKASDCIADVICNIWNLDPKQTALIKADYIQKMGSADAALQSVRTALDEAGSAFTAQNIIGGIREGAATSHNNIVIIDDFSGTGKKISDKIKWIRKEEKKEHVIYVATFASQKISKALIEPVAKEYYSANWLNKAISEHYPIDKVVQTSEFVQTIESRFGCISNQESLGYDQAEALYFPIGINTPNSVFPMFWKKTHELSPEFTPLLSRNAKK